MKEENNQRKDYELIYKTDVRLIPDYNITEEQYFEYYQNSNDPTFENYPFGLKLESLQPTEYLL